MLARHSQSQTEAENMIDRRMSIYQKRAKVMFLSTVIRAHRLFLSVIFIVHRRRKDPQHLWMHFIDASSITLPWCGEGTAIRKLRNPIAITGGARTCLSCKACRLDLFPWMAKSEIPTPY
jgi:hypothetical protein